MTWLARMALRLAVRAGWRWLVLAAGARFVLRRLSRRAVERATAELEASAHNRLPVPVARAVSSLPPGVRSAGGTALVAGRTARTAFTRGRQARRVTQTRHRQLQARWASARATLDRMQDETDASTRRLRSRYLGAAVGPSAAVDALVDRVGSSRPLVEDPLLGGPDPFHGDPVDPHAAVAPPVSPGRRRGRRAPGAPANRPRRTYRPPPKPWD
jgi:hypothetical protein